MKKVLVCGGRDFNNWKLFIKEMYRIIEEEKKWIYPPDQYGNTLPNIQIIHGGAEGADSFADKYAVVNWTELKIFKADWNKYGKSAGFIRNQQMLDEGKPDLVIAFPGGIGTADMVQRAKKAGVEVIEVTS